MGKIKIFIVSVLLLGISCKTEQKKFIVSKEDNQDKEITLIESKINQNFTCYDLVGKWSFIKNNEFQDFHLEFKKNDSIVKGEHCFVKGKQGESIDCATEQSIFLDCSNTLIQAKIESAYSDDYIEVQFGLISKDTLKLKALSDVVGLSFFYNDMLFVKKE